MKRLKKITINTLVSAAFPVAVFVIFWAITALFDTKAPFGFHMLPNVFSSMGVGILIALGMSVNMTTNRIDLSAGAVTTVCSIFVGFVAVEQGWSGWTFMLACVACGVVCTTFSGALYVLLRLPPLVVSLGVTMILESATVLFRNGSGVSIYTGPIRQFGSTPNVFFILAAALIIYHVVTEYTGFAYDLKALAGNKRIASDAGIRENRNVILSYAFSGVFFGLAAVPYIYYYGIITAAEDMSSASVMFDAMLPVLVGGFLAKYSCQAVAVTIAVFSMKMMSYGLICCGINNTIQNVISGVFIIALVFASEMLARRDRRESIISRARMLNEKRLNKEKKQALKT